MSIGDPISQPIPAVGTGGTAYASQIVAFLQEVKSRLTAKVPLSSILAGLLDMANNAIANLQYASLYEQPSSPTDPIGSLQNYLGDLWWVSEAGAAQITSGNSINAAAVAGIGGDYGGGDPSSFRYVAADTEFYAYSDFGLAHWARVGARSYDVYGTLTGTTRVRLTWPGGSNWSLTLPAGPPSSQSLLQMDSSGTLVASNTLPADTNIALSGTGKVLHGSRTVSSHVDFASCFLAVSAGTGVSKSNTRPAVNVDAGCTVYFPLQGVDSTKTVKSFQVFCEAAPGVNVQYTLVYPTIPTFPVLTSFASTGLTVTTSLQFPTASGTTTQGPLWLEVVTPAGGGVNLIAFSITYDSE